MNASKLRSLLLLAAVGGLVCSLGLSEAHGGSESEEAGRLFSEGRSAMKAEEYATAAEKLAASYELDPSPGTLLNLAICEEKLGQLGRAWNHLQAVLEALPAKDPRRPIAQERLDALKPRVPMLVLSLEDGAPSDAAVVLDGGSIDALRFSQPLAVDPGIHTIKVASAQGTSNRKVRIEEGQRRSILLRVVDRADFNEADTVEQDDSGADSNTGAYLLLGVGVAGVATGGYLWMELNKRQDTIDNNCNAAKQCNERGMSAVDEGKSLMPIYLGAWAVGAIGLATGTYFLLDSGEDSGDEPDKTQTRIGASPLPGGAALGVSGRF